ncbi:hypothetical protein [Flavobacterium sp. 102]|uniref:hypothetical protein n=1 Tax=Flavobacterium sp. 102 TaxID=2135623 RepID=UPI000EACCE69|nr:hypothetical protein [Flavobacterium sp. 102]RKS00417.1 hypothetical protein C8C84_0025 [Flavobacterium sp. 102]
MSTYGIVECAPEGATTLNTGAKEQCLNAPVVRHALSPTDQEFATAEAAKTLATWRTAEAAKKIIPLYEIEQLAVADTEDTYYEARKRYKTKNGKKVRTFEVHLGVCSHRALASYHGKKMRVYEFTDAQEIKACTIDGVKVRGQLVTIEVGKMVDATDEKPQYTPVTLTYEDYKEFENGPVVLRPTWSHIELQGIFDVTLTQVSASATSIKFTVSAGCAGEDVVTALETADITLKTALGVAVTHSFVPADANGVYELTGTGFVSTLVVDLDGVVQQTEATYESTGGLSIVVT